jgi:hypothetical protein
MQESHAPSSCVTCAHLRSVLRAGCRINLSTLAPTLRMASSRSTRATSSRVSLILGGRIPSTIFVVTADRWPLARIPMNRPTNMLNAPPTINVVGTRRRHAMARKICVTKAASGVTTGNQFLLSRSFCSIGHQHPVSLAICEHCARSRLLSIGTDEQVRETGDTRRAREMASGSKKEHDLAELRRICPMGRKKATS